MIFVACEEQYFILERYHWLYCYIDEDSWQWTYNPAFGVQFKNKEDAIIFRLKFGDT